MKRRILSLFIAVMMFLLCLPITASATEQSTEAEYAWVLVEVNDYENAEKWQAADAHESYIVKHSYFRGVYSASTTYEGDDIYGTGLGGTLAVRAVFSGVPDVIYPDKPVSLKLSFTTEEDSVNKLSFTASASADFDRWDVGPGGVTGGSRAFKNKDGEDYFQIIGQRSVSYDETLTASLGAGSENSRIALRLRFSFGTSMGTNYVYQWKQADESARYAGSLTANPGSSLFPSDKYDGPIEWNSGFWKKWSEQAKKWTPEEIEEVQKTPSIVKVGDLHGEVWVLRGWEEDQDQFIYVELDTPLYHGDLIVTRRRSGAILSFSDMSTFVMKEDSVIVLDIKNEKESKLALVAGKVWVNLKRMIQDGSMECEMSQAIAGARGTTFICEEFDGASVLKVIEGTVEYTSKVNGESVLVSGEQMITADTGGLGKPIAFNINAELETWDSKTQQMTAEVLAARKGGLHMEIILIIAGVLIIIIAVVIVLVLLKHKKRASSLPAPIHQSPAYQDPAKQNETVQAGTTKYCANCGSALSSETSFCANCGQRLQ